MIHLVLEQLTAVEVGVVAVGQDQLIVAAAFDDAALAQDDDQVCPAHGRDAMGDDERGAPRGKRLEVRQDALLGLSIDRGQGVVQDQDARIAHKRAGQRGALLLAARERDAALADLRLVALGKLPHLVRQVGRFDCPLDTLVCRNLLRRAQGDVRAQRVREEERLLRHETDAASQPGQRQLAHVAAVDKERGRGRVVQAGQEPDERALPRTGRPHDGQRGSGRHAEIDVVKNCRTVAVCEGQAAKLDCAAHIAGRGSVGAQNLHRCIEELETTSHRRLAAFDDVGDPADGDGRPVQHPQIDCEGHEIAERDRVCRDHRAAQPQHQHCTESEECDDEWLQSADQHDQAPTAPQVLVVGCLKAALLGRLLHVGAHDAGPGEVLLHDGAQVRELRLHLLRAVVDQAAEAIDEPGHHEQRQQ